MVKMGSRGGLAAGTLALLLGMTGCVASGIPDATSAPRAGTPTAEEADAPATPGANPTPESTAASADIAYPLDGDAESFVAPGEMAWWLDQMVVNDEFEATTSTTGASSGWEYQHTESGCSIGYWQGSFSDGEGYADDREFTDALLVAALGDGASESLVPLLTDNPVTISTEYSGDVETRGATRINPAGYSVTVAGRAFRDADVAVYAYVTCPNADDSVAHWQEWAAEGYFRIINMPAS